MFKKIIKNKFIIFLGLVALLVLGFFGFWHYRDTMFSKEVLDLHLSGPSEAGMGAEITYTVTYKNTGNFVLEQPKLTFELPENSLTEDSKTRIVTKIKDLNPGESDSISFKARLLGKEKDVKIARAAFSYAPHNLSVRYESDASFVTIIKTVDMDLSFDLPPSVAQNQPLVFNVKYLSSIDYPLENLSIKLEAMPGFTITSAEPTSLDNIEWKLDTLQKGTGGTLKITGTVAPDAPATMTFSARLGMRVSGMFIVLKTMSQEVQVAPAAAPTAPPAENPPGIQLNIGQ